MSNVRALMAAISTFAIALVAVAIVANLGVSLAVNRPGF
jgi:hypothetical protein